MICQFETTEENGLYVHRCAVCGDVRQSRRPKYLKQCGKSPRLSVWRFAVEYARWALAGFPARSDAEVAALFATCQACSLFRRSEDGNGVCGGCGCRLAKEGKLRNKIAMATAHCPLGRW